MKQIWNFPFGYVIITLEGLRLETVLSNAVKQGARILSVERISYTTLKVKTTFIGMRILIRICKQRQIRFCVTAKSLAGKVIAFFMHRRFLLFGILATVMIAIVLSRFCFNITISGLESLSEFAVSEVLEKSGAKPLFLKSSMDLDALKLALYQAFPEIAYAEIAFHGVSLDVTIAENNKIPELILTENCSILAKKDGVIIEVVAEEGQAIVTEGDIVKRGDVLIEGAYTKKETDFTTAARGSVIAKVDYFGSAAVAYDAYEKEKTGKFSKAKYMCLGNFRICLFGENTFETYIEEKEIVSSVGENMPAYLLFEEVTYYEARLVHSDTAQLRAETQAREQAYYDAIKQVPEEAIISEFTAYSVKEDGKIKVTATVSTKEEIGICANVDAQKGEELGEPRESREP